MRDGILTPTPTTGNLLNNSCLKVLLVWIFGFDVINHDSLQHNCFE